MKKLVLFYLFTFAFCFSAFAQTLTVRDIMREPSLAGMRAEGERLSPDGKYVVYLWNAKGEESKDLYLVSTDGTGTKVLVSPKDLISPNAAPTPENKLNYGLIVDDDFAKSRRNQIGNLDWSPDSKRILFSQNGDLYVLNVMENNAKPRRLTKTQSAEFAAQWIDDNRILFSQNGNFFVMDTGNFSLIQASKEANPAAFVSIFNAAPTKNGDLIAYVVSDGSKQKTLFVPNYIDEFVQSPTTRRGFSEQKILVANSDGSLEKPIEIKLPKAEGTGYIRGIDWAADNASLIIDRVDKDLKRRQLFYVFNVGGKDENTILVTEETDEKWVAPLSRIVEPNPKDALQLFFGSERDGYNHLYLATLDKSKFKDGKANTKIKQLTKGNWQVEWAKWNPKVSEIICLSTEKGTATRQFSIINVEGKNIAPFDDTEPNKIRGMIESPQLAEDSNSNVPQVLYGFSKWNQPTELIAEKLCFSCSATENAYNPVKLTNTTPESFTNRKWNEPKFIEIDSRDNKKIPAKIYLPNDFNKSKKYPMVIFVHGAGYLQNVINGWNNYYREFMFNEMLTQKGYVVLDIDYRGSAGYGRDWRTDVYDFLGGKDYDDHLDAIDFMTANYAVDAKRIGVYGGSYGGFMAEMLAFRTDKINCAAALRPVADWKNYYYSSPIYTAERLGFPDKNPEGYKRSSPISYADGLNKPLLILHGLVDDNVPAQDSMQLIEKLIRLEKTDYFDEMIYPAESHAFVRPSSWTDEYTRILNFFEKHLKHK